MHWKAILIAATIAASIALVGCGGEEPAPATPAARATPTARPAARQAATGQEVAPAPAVAVHAAGLYEGTYVANASEFAGKEAADWSQVKVVRVEMGEFSFKPDNLTFEIGQPYKLELVNAGKVKHEFTAEEFFASVAWRKAESAETEVKVPYFTEIEVFPGKQVDLYFVPVTPLAPAEGTYNLVCEIPGHLEAGMRGRISVTGTPPTSPAPVYAKISDAPWLQDGAERVAAADWDKMETIEIELGEFYFKPDELHLKVGQPYKLEVVNKGKVKHEFTAEEFFATVAFRKAEDSSGEFKAPAPLEVEVFPGKKVELFLIPTVPLDPETGTYNLVCEIPGHFEAGMRSRIIVTGG